MFLENQNQDNKELQYIDLIKSQIDQCGKAEQSLFESMVKEIERISNKTIEQNTQIYVYAYSLIKNWIKNRKKLKLDQNIEALYNLLHIVLKSSYLRYKNYIRGILKKDDDFLDKLLIDYEKYKEKEILKYQILDLIFEITKTKSQDDLTSQNFETIFDLSFDNLLENPRARQISENYLLSILDSGNKKVFELFQKRSEQIYKSWFLKKNVFKIFLNFQVQCYKYLSQDYKQTIANFLFEIIKGQSNFDIMTRCFQFLEQIFSDVYFNDEITEQYIRKYVEFYESYLDLYNHSKLFFAFTQSYLQLTINYYHNSPQKAKSFVATFLSFLIEFFADENFQKLLKSENQKDSSSYTLFGLNCIEILVETVFDNFLFKELQSLEKNQEEQMLQLLNQMNFNESQFALQSKTTVSQIFSILFYSISQRFHKNKQQVFQFLNIVFKKFQEFNFKKYQVFNDYMIKFYETIRTGEDNQTKECAEICRRILLNVNMEYFLQKVFNFQNIQNVVVQLNTELKNCLQNQQQFNEEQFWQTYQAQLPQLGYNPQELLDNQQFMYFLYLIESSKEYFEFRPLISCLGYFVQTIADFYIKQKQNQVNQMETEELEENPELLQFNKLFKTFGMFAEFDQQDIQQVTFYFSYLRQLFINDNLPFKVRKNFIKILQNLLIFFINDKTRNKDSQVLNQYIKQTRTFATICQKLIASNNTDEQNTFENLLILCTKNLDKNYIASLLQKNLNKIFTNINNTDLINKNLADCKIVKIIISAQQELQQSTQIFQKTLQLTEKMIQYSNKKIQKMGINILESLIKNVHPSQYQKIQKIFDSNIINNQNKETKFDNFSASLSFLQTLLNSKQLNNDLQRFNVLQYADRYLTFIYLNLKHKNQKTRKRVKNIILQLFTTQIGDQKLTDQNQLLARIIAGLASNELRVKSCTLDCISLIYKKFYEQIEESVLQSLAELAVLLMQEKNKEIYISGLKFFKNFFKYQDKVEQTLHVWMDSIYQCNQEYFSEFRNKIKTLIEVLIKRFDKEVIDRQISENWQKLYRNVRKGINNKKNKLTRDKDVQQQQKEPQSQYDQDKKRQRNKRQGGLIKNFEDETFFFNTIDKKKSKQNRQHKQDKYTPLVYIDKDTGKLIIQQQKAKSNQSYKRDLEAFENEHAKEIADNLKIKEKLQQSQVGTQLGARVLKRIKRSTNKQRDNVHFIQESGESYKNKLAGTDMRLKNRPDPHAFVQFNPVALSKKLRSKASQTFQLLMKKKKKGSLKGLTIKDQLIQTIYLIPNNLYTINKLCQICIQLFIKIQLTSNKVLILFFINLQCIIIQQFIDLIIMILYLI